MRVLLLLAAGLSAAGCFSSATLVRRLLRPATLDELRYKLHDTAGVTVSLDREVRIELAAQ